jgi:hypothetical protein
LHIVAYFFMWTFDNVQLKVIVWQITNNWLPE